MEGILQITMAFILSTVQSKKMENYLHQIVSNFKITYLLF